VPVDIGPQAIALMPSAIEKTAVNFTVWLRC
jgi:hypothetical protein